VLDWFSRRVLSWRLSITMDAAFCVETLEDAMARHGKPEVFNTTRARSSRALSSPALTSARISISMDGKGAWRDNVFVERLWRSVKYEEVCLRAYDSVSDARASIGRYLDFATVSAHARALTARRPIRRTSRRCPSARQLNPGRASTYRRGNSVQTIGATAIYMSPVGPATLLDW
jgi:putative transposase